jgi:hypothetical protein
LEEEKASESLAPLSFLASGSGISINNDSLVKQTYLTQFPRYVTARYVILSDWFGSPNQNQPKPRNQNQETKTK